MRIEGEPGARLRIPVNDLVLAGYEEVQAAAVYEAVDLVEVVWVPGDLCLAAVLRTIEKVGEGIGLPGGRDPRVKVVAQFPELLSNPIMPGSTMILKFFLYIRPGLTVYVVLTIALGLFAEFASQVVQDA